MNDMNEIEKIERIRERLWNEWISTCVMRHSNGVCCVEDEYMCSPRNMTCPFHKTVEQKKESEETWKQHLNALPIETQQHIAKIYYAGKMPWKERKRASQEPSTEALPNADSTDSYAGT